ncbi:barstar family protein [Streptomyces antibioticus]|uniref:barstar family protein n=1 Tax=Streptomyces antibioticus TaxID=1890 RepID=UPI0036BE7728
MQDSDGTFTQFHEALRFPNHFGWNWNALRDCLTDLYWINAPHVLLTIDDTDAVLPESAEERAILFGRPRQYRYSCVSTTALRRPPRCPPGTDRRPCPKKPRRASAWPSSSSPRALTSPLPHQRRGTSHQRRELRHIQPVIRLGTAPHDSWASSKRNFGSSSASSFASRYSRNDHASRP